MPGFGGAEQIEEGGIVGVLVKDGGATAASVQHVIGMASYLSAWNPRHGSSTVRQTGAETQDKVTVPFSTRQEHLAGWSMCLRLLHQPRLQ